MHHPTDRITHTTAFVTPVVEHWLEREIAQWVHPMKDRSDDPSHLERTLLPQSYVSLLGKEGKEGNVLFNNTLNTDSERGNLGYRAKPLAAFTRIHVGPMIAVCKNLCQF